MTEVVVRGHDLIAPKAVGITERKIGAGFAPAGVGESAGPRGSDRCTRGQSEWVRHSWDGPREAILNALSRGAEVDRQRSLTAPAGSFMCESVRADLDAGGGQPRQLGPAKKLLPPLVDPCGNHEQRAGPTARDQRSGRVSGRAVTIVKGYRHEIALESRRDELRH